MFVRAQSVMVCTVSHLMSLYAHTHTAPSEYNLTGIRILVLRAPPLAGAFAHPAPDMPPRKSLTVAGGGQSGHCRSLGPLGGAPFPEAAMWGGGDGDAVFCETKSK